MPKVQIIDPQEVRKPGYVEFSPIPVNQYQKRVKDERAHFTDEESKPFTMTWCSSVNLKPC